MATLSLGMIVKDEEKTLARLLSCAANFCDQMVVLDTGSKDASVDIAEDLGAEVHHFPWVDNFAAARNVAFSHCTGDWIVWLDADDVVTPAVQEVIRRHKTSMMDDPAVQVIMASYHWTWDADGRPIERFDRERFVRRSAGCRWTGAVHETLLIPHKGTVRCPELFIEHRTHPDNMDRKKGRNLAIYEATIDVERADLHAVYQFGCELQWNSRPADAAAAFEVFLRRSHPDHDPIGEQYLARIKAGECRAVTGDPARGLAHYQAAVRLDPLRAEAMCLLGELLASQERWAEALAHLKVAAGLQLPAYTGKYLFPWFYGQRPQAALRDCLGRVAQKIAVARG